MDDVLIIDDFIKTIKLRNKVFKVYQVEYPVILNEKFTETDRTNEYEGQILSPERKITIFAYEHR